MIELKSNVKDYGINLPTSLSEITDEYFENILKGVVPAENYVVIAICTRCTLFELANSYNGASANVTIKVAKVGNTNKEISVGDGVIIDRPTIERAYHVYLPKNVVSFAHVSKYIKDDKDMVKNINNFKVGDRSAKVWTVDFKVIALSEIRGYYKKDISGDCIFTI